jgi:hypothetical protein
MYPFGEGGAPAWKKQGKDSQTEGDQLQLLNYSYFRQYNHRPIEQAVHPHQPGSGAKPVAPPYFKTQTVLASSEPSAILHIRSA